MEKSRSSGSGGGGSSVGLGSSGGGDSSGGGGSDSDSDSDSDSSVGLGSSSGGSSVGGPPDRVRLPRPAGLPPDVEDESVEQETVEDESVDRAGVRWRVCRSAALIFLGVALAVGAALFLVRSSEPSAAAISVELDAARPAVRDSSVDVSAPASQGASPADASPADASQPTEADPAGVGQGEAPAGGAVGDPPGQDGVGTIIVYVTGAVATPGVVTVRTGTRLGEVLDEAGGALPDADLEIVNLAAPPVDGQHIHVLAVGEEPRADLAEQSGVMMPPASAPGPGVVGPVGSGGAAGGAVDINTATLAELESLPRVGPVLGQRIIDWREENGPFLRAEDIDAVPGIGPAMLEGILPLVSVR